jgi:cation:H+ antiporter
LTGLVLLALGALMLLGGAELFAENVASAARRVGLTAIALGVLLAGAEPEEALTAGIASGRGRPQLAVGDAIGANFVVLTLALGLAAVFMALPVSRRVRQYAAGAALAGLVALGVLADGSVGRVEGALLVGVYALAVCWVWWRERTPPTIGELADSELAEIELAEIELAEIELAEIELAEIELAEIELAEIELGGGEDGPASPSAFALVLTLGGLVLMVLGGWLAVTGAERVVTALGLDDTGVGLTLLALATSAEMLALVGAAARHRVAEVAVAGLVGAVAYNATVSLGVGALVAPLRGVGETRFLLVAAACVVLPLTLFVRGRSRAVSRWGGGALVVAYLTAVPLLLA